MVIKMTGTNELKARANRLLLEWCDTLLGFRVSGTGSPYTDGGLICPACHVIHGRNADLVFPLTLLWDETGDQRYLDAAEKLVEWTDFNLTRPDGSWRNDAGSEWKGISAFGAMALGETLFHYEPKLPERLARRWRELFCRLARFCVRLPEVSKPVINYYAGLACVLAMAERLTGDALFGREADRWEAYCRRNFSPDGLLAGEGYPSGGSTPHNGVSERGCHHIDMGYDLEESLPLLLRHAVLRGDGEKLNFYKARLLDHLEFLLPDGAIDNSWGTRHNKWTYWGSRTSDGLLEGLALVCDEPIFANAVERVLSIYERCTSGGLLSLPMAAQAGEPTCLHHSFCHAKALASFILADSIAEPGGALPREREYGTKSFQNGNLLLVSAGGWRATFSTIDIANYRGVDVGGGSIRLLWHERIGPVCAASMADYYPSEPLNMQYLRKTDQTPCTTPMLRFPDGRRSVMESGVGLTADGSSVRVSGGDWSAVWSFSEDRVDISVRAADAELSLPLICPPDESAVCDGRTLFVGESLILASDADISVDTTERLFNQVPGFCCLGVRLPVRGELKLSLRAKQVSLSPGRTAR